MMKAEPVADVTRNTHNYFAQGGNELVIGGKEVKMENIKCPLLVVCAKYDHLVPPSSTEPILDLVGSEDKDFHMFDVGHVGIYISPQSKNTIAPVIGDWIAERS